MRERVKMLLQKIKKNLYDYDSWLELHSVVNAGFEVSDQMMEYIKGGLYTCLWEFQHYKPPSPRNLGIDQDGKHEIWHKVMCFIKVICGGNRSAKTCCLCAEGTMACLGSRRFTNYWHERTPIIARLVAPDYPNSMTKAIVPTIEKFAPPNSYEMKKNGQGHVNLITFSNASQLQLMTYEQTVMKHASVSLDWLGFDEPPPKNIFNENMARLIDRNGVCAMALTPIKEDGGYPIGWIYDEIYEESLKLENNKKYFWVNIDIEDNRKSRGGYLNDESVDRQIEEWRKDETTYTARKKGEFTHLIGRVWKELDHSVHIEENSFDVSDRQKFTRYAAIDVHPRNPMAYVAWAVDQNGFGWIYDEIYKVGRIKGLCELIHEHEKMYGLPFVRFIDETADAKNELTGMNVYREFGKYKVFCRKASNHNKFPYGIPKVRELLHPEKTNFSDIPIPNLKIFRKCTRTWYQMTHYVWDEFQTARSRSENNPREKPRKKDDHCVDCVLYIAENNPRYISPHLNRTKEDENIYVDEVTGYVSSRE